MIRLILILTLVVATFGSVAKDERVKLKQYYAASGDSLVTIRNSTPTMLYCYIRGHGYFVDFYVQPYSWSRSYYEPNGYYEWKCKLA